MSDELLAFYERELAFLREVGAEFALAHPKIAGRLRLSKDSIDDPHVARLIQSIAFLNARTRKKLDDDFPELAQAILGVTNPHYLAPIPSMAIVQFDCSPDLTTCSEVPAGTELETDAAYGDACHFRTCYPVTAWPIQIEKATLSGAPFQAPKLRETGGAAAVLRLRLVVTENQCSIGSLEIDSLRLFLRGQPSAVQQLYELLLTEVVGVAIATSTNDKAPLTLATDCIRPVGFARDEALLPHSGRASHGAMLLAEYFFFPDKFSFIDIVGLPPLDPVRFKDGAELFLYLRRGRELEQLVNADTFALGCTPVVNLYQRRADPIELRGVRPEYRLVPDARSPDSHEIYSIDSVAAVSRDGARREYFPFYGVQHPGAGDAPRSFWSAERRTDPTSPHGRGAGTEMYISLVDLEARPATPDQWILETHITCLNRNRPGKLPFGGGEPRLRFRVGGSGIAAVRCLTPFTETRRPPRGRGSLWRLVSQLSLNHLSISGDDDGAEALREILRLNDFAETEVTRNIIDSVRSVTSRPTMIRMRDKGVLGLCRGTEVTIDLDKEKLQVSGAYQFAVVLDHFLAGYAAINSFVQLVTTAKRVDDPPRRWPPRSGTRVLL